MHDIFISYSKNDAATANAVCHELEAQGMRVWIAPRDVLVGSSWSAQITQAIRGSKVFVLLFTHHANSSQDVLNEVALADEAKLHIVNFRLEGIPPNDGLHYHLRSRHWLDALTPPTLPHIHKLVRVILGLLASEGSIPKPPDVASNSATPRPEPAQEPKASSAKMPPEVMLVDCGANMFRRYGAVGGRLKITTHRVIFETNALNSPEILAEIQLGEIIEVGKHDTMGFIPNAIFIRTRAGIEYKFVVFSREKLIDLLRKQLDL